MTHRVSRADHEGSSFENLSLKGLDQELVRELSTWQAKNFDPARCAFIQSLFKRLSSPHHSNNLGLVEKARNSLAQFKIDLDSQRSLAGHVISDISANFPQQSEVAQALFEQGKFNQLAQLVTRLNRDSSRAEGISALSKLTGELNLRAEDSQQPATLDDMLKQQEDNARSGTGNVVSIQADAAQAHPDLQSMKAHRESMKHFNLDKIIAKAIKDGPQNPGPHNPQMLAVESLMQMHDLSPQYLRRFAAYIETLLWLENPGVKLTSKKTLS